LVFEKNANFFTVNWQNRRKLTKAQKIAKKAENWQKSQPIVIITLFFEKNANFFIENWENRRKLTKEQKIGKNSRKLAKNVNITSTFGRTGLGMYSTPSISVCRLEGMSFLCFQLIVFLDRVDLRSW
jgi:hypothetical protein